MTTTGVLWPTLYQGDGTRIRKWLYGSVLIRDWNADGSTDLSNVTIFEPDGNLNPDLTKPISEGGLGFYDVGSITENGVEFNPKFSVDYTKIWQSRRTQRTDITEDDEEIMFSLAESTPLIDALWYDLPIGTAGDGTVASVGTADYSVTKPFFSDVHYRQIIVIGVDGSIGENGQPEYIVEIRPRVSLCKKNKKQWAAKQVDVTELTYCVYMDPASGFDSKTLRGGIVWLDEGGPVVLPTVDTVTATATTSGHASLVFNQPTSPNQPFTYTAEKSVDGGTTWTTATVDSQALAGQVETLVVSGLVAGPNEFRVTVKAANNLTAVYPVSNSITAT
jgi:hypothetical protein